MILFTSMMVALISTLILTPLSSRAAHRLGIVDKSNGMGIPSTGGLAIFFGFAASIAAGMIIFPVLPGHSVTDTGISWRALCTLILASGGLMTLTGFIDDRIELKPVTKLLLHSLVAVVAGAFFVMKGAQIRLFLDSGGVNWLAAPITMIWLLGITNSVNLLDHADGVTGGVSAISAFFFAVLNYINGSPDIAFISIALAGACIGFLFYNFPPASTYMGDSGSNFLGFTLGLLAVLGVYAPTGSIPWLALMSPLLILAVPLVDTVMVLLYRRRMGTPLFQGDKNHLAHRLSRMGYSRRTTVIILYLISIVMGTTALLLPTLRPFQAVLAFVNAAGVIAVFAVFIANGERRAAE